MNIIERAQVTIAVALKQRADGFINQFTGMGQQGRDIMTAFEVSPSQELQPQQRKWLYRDNIYAGRLVDELVEDALRHGWTVRGMDMLALTEQYRRWRVKERFDAVCKLARRDGNAHIWMICNEADQSTALNLNRPPELLNLVVIEKDMASVYSWDEDLTSMTYGEPLIYTISTNKGSFQVHASRLLTFSGRSHLCMTDRMANDGDDSILHGALDQLKRWNVFEQSTGQLVNEFKVSVLKTSQSRAKTDDPNAATKEANRLTRIATFKNLLGMIIVGDNEDFFQRSVNVTGYKELAAPLTWGLSAAFRTPLVKLFGMAPAGLSSDDEASARNWDDVVGGFQEKQLEPALNRLHELFFAAWNVPVQPVLGWEILWTGREHSNDAPAQTPVSQQPETAQGTDDVSPPPPAGDSIADTAMNGAQVSSLIEVVGKYRSGDLTLDSAIAILNRAFQMPGDAARKILGFTTSSE